MDEDIQFPNPVVRHDLPVRHRHRKYVLAGVLLVVLLLVGFLPQILNSPLGPRVLKPFLSWRLHGTVSLNHVHTSWFGGTILDQFAVRDAEGRVVSFRHFQGDVSLLGWITGSWQLGDAGVEGLYVDYCIADDGFSKGSSIPANMPALSGSLTCENGTIALSRSRLEIGSLGKISDVQRFTRITGKLDFVPRGAWTITLKGQIGDNVAGGNGTVAVDGSLTPGPGNNLAAAALKGDLTVAGERVPTAPLAWIVCPSWSQADYRVMLGTMLDSARLTAHFDDGKAWTTLVVSAGARSLDCRPVIDQLAVPPTVSLFSGSANGATAQARLALSAAVARDQLSALNPLLRYASGEGDFVLTVDSLLMPIARNTMRMQMRGVLTFSGVKLDASAAADPAQMNLLRQMAKLTGETGPVWTLQCAAQPFSMDNGRIKLDAAIFTFNNAAVQCWGTTTLGGSMNLSLAVVNAPKLFAAVPELANCAAPTVNGAPTSRSAVKWVIPLTGTADMPNLDLDAGARALPQGLSGPFGDAMSRFAAQFNAIDNDRAVGAGAGKVVTDILSHYDGQTTQPAVGETIKP